MASFILYPNLSTEDVRAASITKYTDGIVLMGALVEKSTADNDYKETAGGTAKAVGIAIINEEVASQNITSSVTGSSAEFYADDSPVQIRPLVPGERVTLLTTSPVTAGDWLKPAANGCVETESTTASYVVAQALADAITAARVDAIILKYPNVA